MDLTSRMAGTTAILELNGRFDTCETAPVAEWLGCAADAPPAHVVVNMAGVQFTDSAALALLVQGLKRCRAHGGDIHLCELQPPVRTIFEVSRLSSVFRIFSSEAEALDAFQS